jgi:hypothetical protein
MKPNKPYHRLFTVAAGIAAAALFAFSTEACTSLPTLTLPNRTGNLARHLADDTEIAPSQQSLADRIDPNRHISEPPFVSSIAGVLSPTSIAVLLRWRSPTWKPLTLSGMPTLASQPPQRLHVLLKRVRANSPQVALEFRQEPVFRFASSAVAN